MKKRNDIFIFIGLTFGLGILLSLFIGLTGGHESNFILLQFVSMIIPAIAVLLMDIIFKEPVTNLNWNLFPLRWLPVAMFLMPVIIHIVCLPLINWFNGGNFPWQPWLLSKKDNLYFAPDSLGWGALSVGRLIFKILINAISGVIIVSVLAFFEEIGWRAWLLPRLIKIFDVKKGIAIGALIWALWHIPFMISGISYLKGVPNYLILLINPFGIFGAGLVISWFWIKTKSIWIVSIAHGALNNWGQYSFKFMQDSVTDLELHQIWLFFGVNGSLLVLGLIILSLMKTNYIEKKTIANK